VPEPLPHLNYYLEGAVVGGGVSALGAGLVSIGIPKDSVIKYEAALKTDKFLLIVHGTPDVVYGARFISTVPAPATIVFTASRC
jgi:hypothetical protein